LASSFSRDLDRATEAFFGWKNAISMRGRVARGRGAAEIH
jgi:hypothetical protein